MGGDLSAHAPNESSVVREANRPGAWLETVRELISDRYGFWVKELWCEKLERLVGERMKVRGLTRHAEYLRLLKDPAGEQVGELQELMEGIFIGETSFHRNPAQFRALQRTVLPELLESRPSGRIRIASLGCSSGEEPYSLAIAALEIAGEEAGTRVEVVGLDACRGALSRAREGRYAELQLREYDAHQREQWFVPRGRQWEVRPVVRERVRFLHGNLAEALPVTGIDIVFCRNVMIYFREPFTATLLRAIHDAMNPGGFLFLGHTETANEHRDLFRAIYTDDTYFFKRSGRLPFVDGSRFTALAP